MTSLATSRGVVPTPDPFLEDQNRWASSISGTGPVRRLEEKFAALVGHPRALAVANATLGIWAIFHALDIHGADVITTPYTWGGTLAGLLMSGNRPVFVDIDPKTLTLDPDKVERALTRRTKAILAVDIYGQPSDGAALRDLADQHGGVHLVQDCAQSFGAYMGRHHTGFWADAAVFSLGWRKALFAGEGGVVACRNHALYEKLVWLTQHPLRQRRDVPELPSNEMAMNLRMHPVAAAWADDTFDAALGEVDRRRKSCLTSLQFLKDAGLSRTSVDLTLKTRPSFASISFDPTRSQTKIDLALVKAGLGWHVSPPPVKQLVYQQEAFQILSAQDGGATKPICPVAEAQCRRRLQLITTESADAGHPERESGADHGR